MTKKIRLIRTDVIEYEPNPSGYSDDMTIEEMADFDANSEYVHYLFDESEYIVHSQVTWEIIDANI